MSTIKRGGHSVRNRMLEDFFSRYDVPRFTIWIVSECAVRHIPLKHATKTMMTDNSTAADYRSPTSGLISAFFQTVSQILPNFFHPGALIPLEAESLTQ